MALTEIDTAAAERAAEALNRAGRRVIGVGCDVTDETSVGRRGLRINAICPGATDTPMAAAVMQSHPESMKAVIDEIPLGRMGVAAVWFAAYLHRSLQDKQAASGV